MVWSRRWLGLRNHAGLHLLKDREPDALQMLAGAKAELFYPLGEGWERELADPVASEAKVENEYGGSAAGPTSRVSMGKIEEHGIVHLWDLHHDPADMASVARFSNGHYGGQAVKLINGKKGTRHGHAISVAVAIILAQAQEAQTQNTEHRTPNTVHSSQFTA